MSRKKSIKPAGAGQVPGREVMDWIVSEMKRAYDADAPGARRASDRLARAYRTCMDISQARRAFLRGRASSREKARTELAYLRQSATAQDERCAATGAVWEAVRPWLLEAAKSAPARVRNALPWWVNEPSTPVVCSAAGWALRGALRRAGRKGRAD